MEFLQILMLVAIFCAQRTIVDGQRDQPIAKNLRESDIEAVFHQSIVNGGDAGFSVFMESARTLMP